MEDISVACEAGIARISLNRPEVRLSMWRELATIFARFATDRDIRAVILTGAGGNFSVGADISEFEGIRVDRQQSAEYEVAVDTCSSAIAALAKPVVAAISGYCLGGGCHLALACDFRFADRTAMVGIPAAKLSIVYGIRSVQRLLALAGMANAKRILYSGERYDAERARSLGLLDEMQDDAELAAIQFLKDLGAKFMLNGLSMGRGSRCGGRSKAHRRRLR